MNLNSDFLECECFVVNASEAENEYAEVYNLKFCFDMKTVDSYMSQGVNNNNEIYDYKTKVYFRSGRYCDIDVLYTDFHKIFTEWNKKRNFIYVNQ